MSASLDQVTHWIDGRACPSSNAGFFEIRDPLTDEVVAAAACGQPDDVEHAVSAARTAFDSFRAMLPGEREACLLRAATLLEERTEVFVDVLIRQVGSPITKARREISTAVATLRAAAGTVRNLTGKTYPSNVPDCLSFSRREPLGVVAGITPFNVPLIKAVKHSSMALATGNTCVLLPSEDAPSTAVMVGRLYSDAGFPPGACNVVLGRGAEIGDTLTTHPDIRFVGFTGSTRVGRHVQELSGRYGKRVTLEMGGKNPLVILKDADLTAAVRAATVGGFFFQGQICMASSRVIVERPLFEAFVSAFTNAAQSLAPGDLRDPQTMIGPIISKRQRTRIADHLEDAVSKGARIRTGGTWQGNCCLPTVLTDVPSQAVMYKEETFGPVVAVQMADDAAHALALANDSQYGLAASVFTNDLALSREFSDRLQAGMVHVNGPTLQEEAHVPFGGIRNSGFGREGTQAAMDDLTEWKWITVHS